MPDGQVALVPGDLELVRDRLARGRHAAAQAAAALEPLPPCRSAAVGFSSLSFALPGVERLGALGAVAVDRHGLQAQLPALDVGLHDLVRPWPRSGMLTVLLIAPDRNGCTARHHPQVRHVGDEALAVARLEGAVEDGQVLVLQVRRALDRVLLVDVLDDRLDLVVGCSPAAAGPAGTRAVDDLHHAAAGELLVLHQRDVRLHAGRVAVHHEADRARSGASTVTCALRNPCRCPAVERGVGASRRPLAAVRRAARRRYRPRALPVHLHHVEHALAVRRRSRRTAP